MNSFVQQSQSASMYCSPSPRLVVGIDYGTSGTGVTIHLVEGNNVAPGKRIEWPLGDKERKVPSRIAYPADNPSFTMLSPCWGFDIEPDMRAYSFTKLFLDSNAELAQFDDEVLQQTVSLGNPHQALHPDKNKAPVDIVADYLSHVLKFVWKTIQNDSDQSLKHLPVNLRFTIPATWSDRGQDLSRQAVIRAWNFKRPQDTLTLMHEPEAAAESVHAELKYQDVLRAGDGILVCDCGSGTVDITSYLVMDSTGSKLSRITAMQGAKCGGAAIDSRLFDLLKRRLPQQAFDHLNYLIAPGSVFMTEFERVKRVFSGNEEEMSFNLPLDIRIGRSACTMPYFDQDTGEFILTVEDIQLLFDQVIRNIIGLVRSQIIAAYRAYGDSVVNKIVLVGGLASSPYLQRALRQCFEVPGLSVTVKKYEPIMAVSDGSALAASRELEAGSPRVRSPRHYGFGSPSCREKIEWTIVEGKQYQQGVTYTHTPQWSYQLYQEGDFKAMTIPVYSCGLPNPPDGAHVARLNDVTLVGLIVADLSSLDLGGLGPELDAHGRMLYRLDYLVRYIFDAENRALHCTVQALGKLMGMMFRLGRRW